jgi:hypothetical protein
MRELAIRCDDEAGELELFDHRYRSVATGLAALRVSLPEGLYKLSVTAGAEPLEAHLELGGEGVRVLAGERPRSGAGRLRVDAEASVATVRVGSDARLADAIPWPAAGGSGTSLLVLLHAPGVAADPADLALHDAGGERVDLASPLAPGFYRLRSTGTPAEQALWLVRNWELRACLGASPGLAVDLTRTVMGARSLDDAGAYPWGLVEIARHGLMRRRLVVPPRRILEAVAGSRKDPVLGLFGAHLLLLAGPEGRALADEVVTELEALLGEEHPDVAALRFGATGRVPRRGAFALPPMLAASWELALLASARKASVIPRGSLSDRLAIRRSATVPHLVWRVPDAATRLVRSVWGALPEPEARVAGVLADRYGYAPPEEGLPPPSELPADAEVSLGAVVSATGVPAASVRAAARALGKRPEVRRLTEEPHERALRRRLVTLGRAPLPWLLMGLVAVALGGAVLVASALTPDEPPILETTRPPEHDTFVAEPDTSGADVVMVELEPDTAQPLVHDTAEPPVPDTTEPPVPDTAVEALAVVEVSPADTRRVIPTADAATAEVEVTRPTLPPTLAYIERKLRADEALRPELLESCKSGAPVPSAERLVKSLCTRCAEDERCLGACKERVFAVLDKLGREVCCPRLHSELKQCLASCEDLLTGCRQVLTRPCSQEILGAYAACKERLPGRCQPFTSALEQRGCPR